ncbi:MAG: hypothetical protein Q4B86_00120 [Eubacteriales bacterium]|nr:hypothetical protein [Eubacteriales bacterium]
MKKKIFICSILATALLWGCGQQKNVSYTLDTISESETGAEISNIDLVVPTYQQGTPDVETGIEEDEFEYVYEMSIYSETQNEKSSVEIQYPWFKWDGKNKAPELNQIILNKIHEIAYLDPESFPENPKVIASYQSEVTLLNSKVVSIVFWGEHDIEGSQFPTTNLYTLNIDLQSLREIQVSELYEINKEFEEIFFEKAFFRLIQSHLLVKNNFQKY